MISHLVHVRAESIVQGKRGIGKDKKKEEERMWERGKEAGAGK